MKCPACGYDNAPGNLFCTKCLERLSNRRPQAVGGRKVVSMPPQSDHLVDISYKSGPDDSSSAGWGWLVALLIAGIIIFLVLYAP